MNFDIITIFPYFFDIFLNNSIVKRAQIQKKVKINIHDLRKYSQNKHNQIDDRPYSGDVGMLLTFPPLYDCLQKIKTTTKSRIILLSPQGILLNQKKAYEYVQKLNHLVILCGNYEGVDARILNYVDEEISIGDYILTGGEIAAMVVMDTIIRLTPGVIKKESYLNDSHQNGLLKYPQYTRPQNYKNQKVPEVLLSGDHKKIIKWKEKESLRNTFIKRPELLKRIKLSENMKKILEEIKKDS
ncbi:tRNA (guanosine(37)-N1)-methyltransferase TrmD [Candidatus Phytoplasma melaleucae]|uniref:tRNA (guanine-N(1)-)-methyltransferase n=1 Tax=Candidatus Phytoplasma melaleucae TaxID=2982630 RepID=A0ABT9DDQ6_9MOLU|nr:tRNA (guanosine(37)-N1)-methyltransferase TrmD ['Melaleuca sp.' phytoplasma]MDO8168167.1 tRNA (guanosine(37)-N1)-methyltransferase TrmD ['Melaleuca sp.' phytoplasma]